MNPIGLLRSDNIRFKNAPKVVKSDEGCIKILL